MVRVSALLLGSGPVPLQGIAQLSPHVLLPRWIRVVEEQGELLSPEPVFAEEPDRP